MTTQLGTERWVDQNELAEVYRISPISISKWASVAPLAIHRMEGRKRLWLWPAVAAWRRNTDIEDRLRKTPLGEDEALLAGDGSDSPALERLRQAKAEREELKLAQDRKDLVLVADIKQSLAASGATFRRRIEAIARTYPHVADAVTDALQDTLNELREQNHGVAE